jgi:hypothetical protein
VHSVSDVRQIEIRTAEIAIAKLKKYKSPGSNEISAELIKAGGETLLPEIHKLISCIWNKEELPYQLKGVYYCPSSQKGL